MSTFDGIIDEFPDIRIDHFRVHPNKPPPQACFLSHIHSDHLQGLETLKMPFVYCSAATKNILLQMEKYPHRINFAKGILEARKQTYKHLKSVLRPLPLETPVELELGPKSRIRVTLFDANHCPGAVMFLIEGHDKAIMYTGDVRAEPWWVNSITRNPLLIPYCAGMKQLDCIYLDTTFASHDDVYQHFPTKAEGIKELLNKVDKCPKGSIYYFRSWTLGYEDVWIALSNFLKASIHVDNYQLRVFNSLANGVTETDRGSCLAGFEFGNQFQTGCLTNDTSVSIHSCEPGTSCHDKIKKQKNIVWISPIISRLKDGSELPEVGAGGGVGDLHASAQLEVIDEAALKALETLCVSSVKHEQALLQLGAAFAEARAKGDFNISIDEMGLDHAEELTLKDFIDIISSRNKPNAQSERPPNESQRIIHFPYSRHSSYSELRHLVSSFEPKDICPCTIDLENWSKEVSMRRLFGDICSSDIFKYDQEVRAKVQAHHDFQKTMHGTKRKRGDNPGDSPSSDHQKSHSTEEVYESARTSLHGATKEKPNLREHSEDSTNTMPSLTRRINEALAERFNQDIEPLSHTVEDTRIFATESQTLETHSDAESDTSTPHPTSSTLLSSLSPTTFLPIDFDPISPSPSKLKGHKSNSRHSNPVHNPTDGTIPSTPIHHPTRIQTRKRAYHAATTALTLDDYTAWYNLRLRSTGWKGHTEEETIL